jgi:hypothetical protein
MFRDLWKRLTGSQTDKAVERETEREQMSPSERHHTGESVDDLQADSFVGEHLGGVPEDQLSGDYRPPSHNT